MPRPTNNTEPSNDCPVLTLTLHDTNGKPPNCTFPSKNPKRRETPCACVPRGMPIDKNNLPKSSNFDPPCPLMCDGKPISPATDLKAFHAEVSAGTHNTPKPSYAEHAYCPIHCDNLGTNKNGTCPTAPTAPQIHVIPSRMAMVKNLGRTHWLEISSGIRCHFVEDDRCRMYPPAHLSGILWSGKNDIGIDHC